MAHDVRMPDGTIIRNVPEGITKAQLMQRYGGHKAPPPAGKALKGAGLYGLADTLTGGFLDELGAVADTLGIGMSGEKRPNIFNGSGFKEAYRRNQAINNAELQATQAAHPGQFMAGQIAGALVPVPIGKALKVGAGASRIARAGAALAPHAAQGAVYGFGSTQGNLAQRAEGAATGAATGILAGGAARAVGGKVAGILKGKTVSAPVRTLADAGIVMTPGKRGGKIARTLEEGVLGTIPFVKDIPAAAQERSISQLNVAMANKSLAPIGIKFPMGTEPGHNFNVAVQDAAYGAYDNAISGLTLKGDEGTAKAVGSILKSSGAKVGPLGKQLDELVTLHISPLAQGQIGGRQVQGLMSDLRADASKFATSPNANERNLGEELWKLHGSLEGALERQNGGEAVKAFKDARSAVANVKRFSAATAKGNAGIATPNMFSQAMKQRGFGVTTDKVSRGEGEMLKLADAAKQVLPERLPNSGTSTRALAAGGILGGGQALLGTVNPAVAGLTALHLGQYVPGVDRALQNLALNRPNALVRGGNAVNRLNPYFGAASTMAALGYSGSPGGQ